jgi:hypothetical protein
MKSMTSCWKRAGLRWFDVKPEDRDNRIAVVGVAVLSYVAAIL